MNCPYCNNDKCVELIGSPTVALITTLGPMLGFGILGLAAATALVAKYKIAGKCIYKCKNHNKYFIA